MSFRNYSLTKGGQLTIAQIMSPDFVHGVSGWRLGKDGSLEAHDVIIPAGSGGTVVTFAGAAPSSPNVGDVWYNTSDGLEANVWNGMAWVPFQIGTGAIGTGAVGTSQLSASVTARSLGGVTTSISPTAPSSPLTGDLWFNAGNGYQLEQYNGSAWVPVTWNGSDVISAGTVTAATIAANTITAAQIAAGTITATQISAGAIGTTQLAANAVTAAKIAANTITAAQIAANTITASQLAAGIVYAGIVNGTTITGATIVADGSSGEFLVYSGTPATGNLVASVSPVSGTDSHSNAYKAGVVVYDTSGTSYVQLLAASPAEMNVGTGDTAESIPGRITSLVSGSGAARFIQTSLAAAHMTGEASGAGANCQVISPNEGLTTPPIAQLVSSDGTNFCVVEAQPTQIYLNGPVNATEGTESNPTKITTGTWHAVTLANGWGTQNTIFSVRLMPDNTAWICGELRQSSAPSSTTVATLAAPYLPVSTQFGQIGVTGSVTSAASPYIQISPTGVISVNEVTISGNPIILVNFRYPLDL